jgi:hypothetical protein
VNCGRSAWLWGLVVGAGLGMGGVAWGSEAPVGMGESEVMGYLEEHLPEVVPALQEAKEVDPEAYAAELGRVRARILEIEEARQRSPELAEVLLRIQAKEFQVRALAQGLAAGGEAPTAEQLAGLRGVLEEIFALRVRLPELEMGLLEGEIRRIRERLEAHRGERDRVVQERLDAVLADPNRRLSW